MKLLSGTRPHMLSAIGLCRVCVAICIVTLVLSHSQCNATEPGAAIPDRSTVSTYVDPLIKEGGYVGVAIGIVTASGSKVYGFGNVKRQRPERPSGETVFALASVTKTFTGVLLADMIRRGVVRLDDPISRYLPKRVLGPRNPLASVTLLDLATHTAGFPKNLPREVDFPAEEPRGPLTVRQLYRFLRTYRPGAQPGSEFHYSNIGMALLGHILELAAGQSYETMVEERICKPLGMKSTRVDPTPAMARRMAQGYGRGLNPVTVQKFDVGKSSGGLYSTADDMVRYVATHMGLVKADIVPAMVDARTPHRQVPGKKDAFMGLGWHIRRVRGIEIITKNGGVRGFQSYVAFVPNAQIGVVALANASPEGRELDRAGRRILFSMLDADAGLSE
ncbi:MAG: serine hydrolase domain-containing protein [Thermodesulfobacteriota bacterium]